jgi:hypothetical protein
MQSSRSRWASWTGLLTTGSALGLAALEPVLSRPVFVLSVIGWATLSGGLIVLLLLRCTAPSGRTGRPTSRPTGRPTSRGTLRGRAGAPSPQAPGRDHDTLASTRAAAAGFPTRLDHLSTADLCRAWCRSTTALQGSASATYRMAVVELRATYLDELERRHPSGIAAWLASDDRSAVDPTPFVRAGDRPTRRTASRDDRDRHDG